MSKTLSDEAIINAFEALAENLSIQIRYEKGDFKGGICRVDDKKTFIINKDLQASKKIDLLAKEFALYDLEDVYILPVLRTIIDNTKKTLENKE